VLTDNGLWRRKSNVTQNFSRTPDFRALEVFSRDAEFHYIGRYYVRYSSTCLAFACNVRPLPEKRYYAMRSMLPEWQYRQSPLTLKSIYKAGDISSMIR